MHNGAIMPTEVRHRMETGQPFPVVRLSGVLDLDTGPHVSSVLRTGLAEQPPALVIDVSDLQVTDPDALAMITEVVQASADWPASTMVICAPTSAAAQWKPTGLPVWPSLDAALGALDDAPPMAQLRTVLEPVVGAARRARELVTEACARWDIPSAAGPACIVVTEMVNNVVAHAHTAMTVRLALHDGTLLVAVQDADSTVPAFRGPVAPTAYGGRGLLLIDSVARRWGSLSFIGGKVVWAVLDPDDDGY
jgi:anti-anti-sigma regulatory factor